MKDNEFKKIITTYPLKQTEDEAKFLFNLPRIIPRKGVIVEIGAYKGGSTIILAKGSKIAKKGKVYSIDHHNAGTLNAFKENINKAGVDDFVIPIVNFSKDVANKWEKPISLLWIDGSHDYYSVKMDFLLWEKFLVKGGIIAFHDSRKSHNNLLLNSEMHKHYYGPKKVVKEYILNLKRFKNIGFIDTITYAQKVRNQNQLELLKKLLFLFQCTLKSILERFDRTIGRIGIFLKKYNLRLYHTLKKIKS